MKAISVVLPDREMDLVDFLVDEEFARSRADLARQAILEFARNRGFIPRGSK